MPVSGDHPINMESYDQQGCLHEIFVKQAQATPDAVAVVTHDGKQVSYRELDEMSNILATRLRHLGVKRNAIVGIFMERCLEYIVSYIGILKAGGAYMPLEVSYPQSLLENVLEDSTPTAVCTKSRLSSRLQGAKNVEVLEGDWVGRMTEENSKLPAYTEQPEVHLDDMAYTVYSSGTTGKPKGIQCPHRGAVFSYHWRHCAFPYEKDDKEACNVFFVWELLRPLLKGCTLYIIPDDVIYDPPKLLTFLQTHRITRMLFTPSLLEAVLDYKGLDLKDAFSSLRQIWFCGEVVTVGLRDRVAKMFPGIRLLNLYSVSECHDISCADLTNMIIEKSRKFCPVGRLLPGVEVVIMDDEMRVQPVGAPGEIYVGGPTLAIGYLNRPELNSQRFIVAPPGVPSRCGNRLYRTGDWGYMLSNGSIEICGRCDSMVKIRGYSIELQAVEVALLQLPMVNTGCVLALGEEGTDKRLVAYIVPEGNTSRKEIRTELKRRLPFYMIPSILVFLRSIPILESSGKLDKKSLPKEELDDHNHVDPEDLPSTNTERRLASIWGNILQLKFIDVNENFFDLGGHSLLATRLISEVNELFGCSLDLGDLFANSTVASMADLLDNSQGKISKIDLLDEVNKHDQAGISLDIRLRAFWRSIQLSSSRCHQNKALLTGCTGFLGAFLLKEMLLNTEDTVYCLVREIPGAKPLERIEKTMTSFGILSEENSKYKTMKQKIKNRVIPIRGDVGLVNLGMKEDDYLCLSFEVDYIIHAAATVNLVYPYKPLYSANVLGTQNVVLFAENNKVKPLHYISTDAVFPSGLKNCEEDAEMTQYADQLCSGYSQTKWVAEQLVLRARDRGLPATIYRCGNIAGSIEGAFWNPADFTLLMIKSCCELGIAPNVDWQIELTPVDFVIQIVVKMSQNIAYSVGKIFHLINAKTMDCRSLWQLLQVEGHELQILPFNEWKAKVIQESQKDSDSRGLAGMAGLLNGWDRDTTLFSCDSTFRQDNLHKILTEANLKYPPVSLDLMRGYLKDLTTRNVVRKAQKSFVFGPTPLNGRVALVTGASSGIGAAIARRLALAGAKTALAARRVDRLSELQIDIQRRGGTTVVLKLDVTNREEVENGVQQTEELLGPIDILVNSAGVMYYTLMKNVHWEEWRQMVDVNVNGVLNCTGAVLKSMTARGSGHIVNISSDAGRKGFAGLAVYSGTKFFVEGLSQALRAEMASTGVKVTSIQPGDVRTEISVLNTDIEAQEQYDMSKQTKILEPEDIAEAVAYAVSQPEYCAVNEILVEPRTAPV